MSSNGKTILPTDLKPGKCNSLPRVRILRAMVCLKTMCLNTAVFCNLIV